MDLLDAIGATPLVELPRTSPKPGVRLFAKLEGHNPSGSIKDRIALALVLDAEKRGLIRPGDTLVEASTGNTALGLAMVARQRGYRLHIVLPEGVVGSIPDLLTLYGVEVTRVRPEAGMRGAIEASRALARERGWHSVGQFDNPVNRETHYRTTGAEIARQLPEVDVVVAGIGTGGTVMGVGARLRELNPDVRVIGVEPRMGEHLQGIANIDDGYRPPLLDLDALSGRYLVTAARALALAAEVARVEGILAGASSGAALHGALRVAETLERGNIVVLFSDGGWKYLPSRPWQAAAAGECGLDDLHWW